MNATKNGVVGCNFFVEVEGCSWNLERNRSYTVRKVILLSIVMLLEDSD